MSLFGFGPGRPTAEARKRVAELRKRLNAGPTNVACALALADALVETQASSEAVRVLNQLGPALKRNGQILAAMAVYKKVAELDPSGRQRGTAASLQELRLLEESSRSKKIVEPAPRLSTGDDSSEEDEQKPELKLETIQPLLKTIPLFKDVPMNVVYDLIQKFHLRSFDTGEVLFEEGAFGSSILFVVSGEIAVTGKGEMGRSVALRTLAAGDVAGEISFLSSLPRSATLTALSPAAVLELERRAVDPLIRKSATLRQALSTLYRERVLNDVLLRSALFGNLPSSRRDEIAEHLKPLSVPAGNAVPLDMGLDGDLYLVSQGVVRIHSMENGEDVDRAMLSPPEFFANMKQGTDSPLRASALTDVELFTLSSKALAVLLRDFPALRMAIELVQLRRLRASTRVG